MKEEAGSKECFVISPIGEENSDVRKKADLALHYIIRPAIEACGYRVYRADEEQEPGVITEHILGHLIRAELVVADLTDSNPNVFYELAISHALHKPTLHLITKGQKIPFDVSLLSVIRYDLDLQSADHAKKNLQEQIGRIPESRQMKVFSALPTNSTQSAEPTENISLAEHVGKILVSIDELGRRLGEVQDLVTTVPHKQLDELWSFISNRAAEGVLPTSKGEYERTARLEADVRIGDTAYAQGDLGLAYALYEQVLKSAPGHRLALIGKGKILRRRWEDGGKIDDLVAALAVVDECVRLNPKYERAYYNRACYKALLLREGHATVRGAVTLITEDALNDLRQAIQLFDYYRKFANADKDFDGLRQEAGFSDLLKSNDSPGEIPLDQ